MTTEAMVVDHFVALLAACGFAVLLIHGLRGAWRLSQFNFLSGVRDGIEAARRRRKR